MRNIPVWLAFFVGAFVYALMPHAEFGAREVLLRAAIIGTATLLSAAIIAGLNRARNAR
jgi:hypothetical protein